MRNLHDEQFIKDFYKNIPRNTPLDYFSKLEKFSSQLNDFFNNTGSSTTLGDIASFLLNIFFYKKIHGMQANLANEVSNSEDNFDMANVELLKSWAINLKEKPSLEELKNFSTKYTREIYIVFGNLLDNNKTNFTVNDLLEIFANNAHKTSDIANNHLRKEKVKLSLDDFLTFIENFAKKYDYRATNQSDSPQSMILGLTETFITNEENIINLQDLENISRCIHRIIATTQCGHFIKDYFPIEKICIVWLSRSSTNLNYKEFKNSLLRSRLDLFEKEIIQRITYQKLPTTKIKEIFADSELTSFITKDLTAENLKNELQQSSFSRFERGVISLLYIEDLNKKMVLSADEFAQYLSLFDESQSSLKQHCVENYITKNHKSISAQDLLSIIQFPNDFRLIKIWIDQFESIEKKQEIFLEILNRLPLLAIDFEKISDFARLVRILDLNNPEFLIQQANIVFVNAPFLKKHFYEEFYIQDETIELTRKFLNSIDNEQLEFEYLKHLNYRWQNNLILLELIEGRLDNKFALLKNIFGTRTIADVIKVEATETIQATFESSTVLSFPIASLFSYYYLKGEIDKFLSLLNDNFVAQIKQNFTLPTSSAFITKEEYDILKCLLNEEHLVLPRFSWLCNFVSNHKTTISEEVDIDSFNFNFEGETAYDSDTQSEMELLFKEIVSNSNSSEINIKITKFINLIIHDEKQKFAEKDLDKIKEVFLSKKAELLHVFSSEGGVTLVKQAIYAAGDGCVANIGTVFTNAIDSFLITDMAARILDKYMRFIMLPIFTKKSKSDFLGSNSSGIDYLTLKEFKSCRILPVGIILEIAATDFKASDYIIAHAKIGDNEDLKAIITDPILDNLIDRKERTLASKTTAALTILKRALLEDIYNMIKDNFCDYIEANSATYTPEVKKAIYQTLTILDVRDFVLTEPDMLDKATLKKFKSLVKTSHHNDIPKSVFTDLVKPICDKLDTYVLREINKIIDRYYSNEKSLTPNYA